MELQTGGTVGSDGWNYRRSVGQSDVIPISEAFPPKISTEPPQSLRTSDKNAAELWVEAWARSAKRELEDVARRTTVFVTHDFNES